MKLIFVIAFVVCFGLVGGMDYQDQMSQQKYYCQMVDDGYWPNYDQSINCDTESGNAKTTKDSES